MSWPTDADGDVLRRLQNGGFDFSKPTLIDFNVTYELVMNVQSEVTELMAPFRGECSSWGVLV